MVTHATQFKKALGRIEPEQDAENAADAHRQVTEVLEGDDRLRTLGISCVLIGSYGRQVSIRRVKDVDLFARLQQADENLRPGDILDHVTTLLEENFPDHVERQHRSVKVSFDEYDLCVDVVIARPCIHHDDHWQIPQKIEEDGRASWVETNPTKLGELTTEANKSYLLYDDDPRSGVYVPLVKLVRQVRRTWVDRQPGGFYFEILTYHAFDAPQPNKNTVAEYLVVVLKEIAARLPEYVDEGPEDPTLPDATIKTKATSDQIVAAAARMAEAVDLAERALAEEDQCRSAVLWRQLLGETHNTDQPEQVFLLPEYCNAYGTTRTAATIVRGAPAVPAGRDRYA